MALRKHRPNTNAVRQRVTIDRRDIISQVEPLKSLTKRVVSSSGRDASGQISVRHKSGGTKKKYRVIDFRRNKDGIPAIVKTIEYDPNRNTYISLLHYNDGEKRYILTPAKMKVGDIVESGTDVDIRIGNALPLKFIPLGTSVHNIEMKHGHGGQMVRAAGAYAIIQGKNEGQIVLKLPSGEFREIDERCKATIGVCSNSEDRNKVIGKAGINRKRGKRPTVRGVAMNPCDHPHGGGEGKAPVGRPRPLSPTGKPALGQKTRKTPNTKARRRG